MVLSQRQLPHNDIHIPMVSQGLGLLHPPGCGSLQWVGYIPWLVLHSFRGPLSVQVCPVHEAIRCF